MDGTAARWNRATAPWHEDTAASRAAIGTQTMSECVWEFEERVRRRANQLMHSGSAARFEMVQALWQTEIPPASKKLSASVEFLEKAVGLRCFHSSHTSGRRTSHSLASSLSPRRRRAACWASVVLRVRFSTRQARRSRHRNGNCRQASSTHPRAPAPTFLHLRTPHAARRTPHSLPHSRGANFSAQAWQTG